MAPGNKEEQVKEFYEMKESVSSYDCVRFAGGGKFVDQMEKEIVKEMVKDIHERALFLDVATGSGRFALMLAKMGFTVIAFDYSFEMLKLAKEKAKKELLKIYLINGDVNRLPFKRNSFDASVSLRFLWHYPNFIDLTEKVMHTVKPGGYFVFDLFNIYSLRAVYLPFSNLFVYTKLTTKNHVKRELSKRGFVIEEQKNNFIFPYLFYRKAPTIMAKGMFKLEKMLQKSDGRFSSVMYFKLGKQDAKTTELDNIKNEMDEDHLLTILACPFDGGSLHRRVDTLSCQSCNREFSVKDGIYMLKP